MRMKIKLHFLLISLAFISCSGRSEQFKDSGKIDINSTEELSDIEAGEPIEQSQLSIKSDCDRCTIDNLRILRNEEMPSAELLQEYLLCCNKQCFLNIEYAQASNYSIFLFIQDFPKEIVRAIQSNIDSIDVEFVNEMLQNPVSDDIDVQKTLRSLISISSDSEFDKSLIQSLLIALGKSSAENVEGEVLVNFPIVISNNIFNVMHIRNLSEARDKILIKGNNYSSEMPLPISDEELKNFSLSGFEQIQDGFEIIYTWGGGNYYYERFIEVKFIRGDFTVNRFRVADNSSDDLKSIEVDSSLRLSDLDITEIEENWLND